MKDKRIGGLKRQNKGKKERPDQKDSQRKQEYRE